MYILVSQLLKDRVELDYILYLVESKIRICYSLSKISINDINKEAFMKKEKNTFSKLISFNENECQAVERYLEEKALEGWILCDINLVFFKFKKSEPKKVKYTVDIFTDLKIGEYKEYCEASGWKYIGETKKYLIFYTEDENITPIQTDEKLLLKKVGRSMLENIISYIVLTFILIRGIYEDLFTDGFWDNTEGFEGYYLFLIIISFVLSALPIIQIVRNSQWYFKLKKSLKLEKSIEYPSINELKIKMACFNLYIRMFAVLITTLMGMHMNINGYISLGLAIIVIIIFIKDVLNITNKRMIKDA